MFELRLTLFENIGTHHLSGKYLKWDGVLEFFKQDVAKATELVQKRRLQPKGTSRCRNEGVETFLVFEEQKRSWTTTSIEACPVLVASCLVAQIHN